MSLDELCMDHVEAQLRPAVRRLPPLCWWRIRHDLQCLLQEFEADKTILIRWSHAQFSDVSFDLCCQFGFDDFPSWKPTREIRASMY